MRNIKEEHYFIILKIRDRWILDYTTLSDTRLTKKPCSIHKNSSYGRVAFLQDAVSICREDEAKGLLKQFPLRD